MIRFIDSIKYKGIVAIGLLFINYISGFIITVLVKSPNHAYTYDEIEKGSSWFFYIIAVLILASYVFAGMTAGHRRPTIFSSGLLLFIFSMFVFGAEWFLKTMDIVEFDIPSRIAGIITNSTRYLFLSIFRNSGKTDIHTEISIVCAVFLFAAFLCGFLTGLATRRKRINFNFDDED